MSNTHLSEQEIIRRQKLAELRRLGIDPYPAALYPINATTAYIRDNYKGEENKDQFSGMCIAGRIMSVRDMGKANFAVLQKWNESEVYAKTAAYFANRLAKEL